MYMELQSDLTEQLSLFKVLPNFTVVKLPQTAQPSATITLISQQPSTS